MRGATKMLMVRNGSDNVRGNEQSRPYSGSRGTLTWDNTRGAESAYRDGYGRTEAHGGEMNYPRSEIDEPESRRRRDSRGRFRSEMDGGSGGNIEMHHPGPYFPPPVYERMNTIGFAAHDGSERGNLLMMHGGASERHDKLDDQTAREWMENLQNEDGSKGPHWTIDQTTQVMKKKGISCDPLEFWVAMNAMYSDYSKVAQKYNVNNVDYYADLAKAWLYDSDAVKNKAAAYYHYVVE